MKLACLSSILLVLSASLPVCAQQAAAAPSAPKTQAREVTLSVGVHDKHGALVGNLGPSDLTLAMDGRPQTIKSLTRESPLPFRVGLLVDTGRGLNGALDAERKAAASFVDLMLTADPKQAKQDDRLFLIHFDRQVELLRDFTNVRAKLHSELDEMSASRGGSGERRAPESNGDERGTSGKGREGAPGRGGMNRSEGAQLYDAIFLASDELMKAQTGRKALVVFSGGVDSDSKETLNDAIDAADRAGLEIYAIYLKPEEQRGAGGGGGGQPGGGNRHGGVSWPGSGGNWPGSGTPSGGGSGRRGGGDEKAKVDGRKILEKIATRTGGRFYEAKKKENLDEIYKQIAEELHGRYMLAFTPDKDASDGQYHKFEVKAKKDGLAVSAREGYYAEESK